MQEGEKPDALEALNRAMVHLAASSHGFQPDVCSACADADRAIHVLLPRLREERLHLLRCLDAAASVLLLAKRFAKETTERNRRDFMDAIKRHEERVDALAALEGGPYGA